MANIRNTIAVSLFLITLLLVSACGGSGGNAGENNTESPATPTQPISNSSVTGSISIVGENTIGSLLSVEENLEDNNGLGPFNYQWLRDDEPIPDSTDSTYRISDIDAGKTLKVVINYTDSDGFDESVTSAGFTITLPEAVSQQPNILFIISDDQGVDASSQYSFSADPPITPNFDALASNGLVFDNTWVTPACTTTRAAILTGMHGVNSGVTTVPDVLDTELQTFAKYLKSETLPTPYATGAFGKWHLAGVRNTDTNHPNNSGFDYYAGSLTNISDYNSWELTVNGSQFMSDIYHTTAVTNLAIEWVNAQTQPWFAWVAFQAPHTPLHLPPSHLHTRNELTGSSDDISNTPRAYYLAAIEAIDTEIGRLLASLDENELENTIIVFIGDNGTPVNVVDTTVFSRDRSKSTLYEGGIRVPLIISGKGVTRFGQRESTLVNATDFYTTLGEAAGLPTKQLFDSTSFFSLFSGTNTSSLRTENYTEFVSDDVTGWTVRDDTLKLIQYEDGEQELYDLTQSINENNNLINDTLYAEDVDRLLNIGLSVRGEQQQSPIDITELTFTRRSENCADYVESYTSSVLDLGRSIVFNGALSIAVANEKCIFNTNAIPNHDFNDGAQAFPNEVSAQNDRYEVTTTPEAAASTTPLSLQTDNAILLNGVKVDLLAAGCFGIGNGKVGCGDINQPWRYDPMFTANGFNVDSHNAHAQADGTYHYHGTPNAFYHEHNTGSASPVIGFAADGFPIFGPYFEDNGAVRKALSSYKLRDGERPNGDGEPGGSYDGAFRDDYEYVDGLGDLDECNGMTIDGVYGYYVTDNFPYILGCFKGVTDPSFDK